MKNIQNLIIPQLQSIAPCQYELFLNPSTAIPCISYQVIQNTEEQRGNINGYSRITLRLKVWSTKIEEICRIQEQIDDKLAEIPDIPRVLRTSVGELTDGELICSIMDYQFLLEEYYSQYRF